MERFDRTKPHKQVKDFVTGHVTYIQNGKQFGEGGVVLIGAPTLAKYPCAKCDYAVDDKNQLLIHAIKVHHADEKTVEAFKRRIKNIDQDLPIDEGIDWQATAVKATVAQESLAEREKVAAAPAEAPAKQGFKCPSCEFQGRNQQSLAAHKRHTHKG